MSLLELIDALQAIARAHPNAGTVVEIEIEEGKEYDMPLATVEYDHHTKKVILK